MTTTAAPDTTSQHQRILAVTTLVMASLACLGALWGFVETRQAVADDEFLAELGYVVVIALAAAGVLGAALTGLGLWVRSRTAASWLLWSGLVVVVAPFVLGVLLLGLA
ncbi:hypothetical protein [Nocardioides dongkuii]|uniref:hypothetical protein n=1 Tax=Nocardioides dongkuii TaxID=2760089 RepID=UPI0015FDDBBF|nr:hypothetical protein [Nocardioides dongkuii]